MITITNLSLGFLGKQLFNKINLHIKAGEHIGLVGPNGSGKTTLLRLLAGEITPDSGEIRFEKGLRLGYLPQDAYEALPGNLLASLINAIPNRVALKKEMVAIEKALASGSPHVEQEKMATRLADIHHELTSLDSLFPPHKAEKILLGLGFKPDDFSRPLSSLSGGWKMRAALARLLYQNPDLLLLDEPTNHLDLPSVRWLEAFLQDFKGSMILVSHDRDFLNRQTQRTLALEVEGLRVYSGNYDFYLKAREEERKALEAKARNQEQRVKEARKFIEKFRAKASKARQAQSKIKLLDKMALVETYRPQKTIHFSFPKVSRSGRVVVTLDGVSKGFGSNMLYKNLYLKVLRGEKIAVVGPNGAGKTTLLRLVAGEIEPDEGQITLGHGVTMSYYAQHHSEMLDPAKSVLEEVYQVVPHESISFVRGICGAFLFPGQDVEKAVGILSGGEKARVSLAKILVRPGNLMVMDEPTNHLDIISSEVLIDALADFNGTLLFVSHNQSFVNRLATKIWDIRDQGIKEYPGTLYEYYDHLSRKGEGLGPGLQETQKGSKSRGQKTISRKMKRAERAKKRGLISATLKPIQKKLQDLEERIDELERKKTELEAILSNPELFKDQDRSLPLLNEYGNMKKKLEDLMGRWERGHEELERAKRKFGLL